MTIDSEDQNMEIDEVITTRLSPLEIHYSENFENWLQSNCGSKETRFFRSDFIDSMTYDLQSKRNLKFASFLDDIGQKGDKQKFLKELPNKTLSEHYPKISTLHALHAATYEDIVLALMTWNGGKCSIKETLLALNYAESAIYDQIWFCELNDIGSEEIQAHFFFEALSCLLSDATQKIMNAFEAKNDAETILRKLDSYLNIFLYLNKSINNSTEYRDDKLHEIKQSVDCVRAKWFSLSSSLESASLANFIERLFLEDCFNCNSKRRCREDQESWKLKENPKTTMENYSSLCQLR